MKLKKLKGIRIFFIAFFICFPQHGYAQQEYLDDAEVNTVFSTGGYGALFGAAMGAALLPFMNNSPMQNFRIVAGGASVGFMFGSMYGFYSVANAKRNSFFNYSSNIEEDSNTYYSMPPTMQIEGNNAAANRIQTEKPEPKIVIGALISHENHHLRFGIPMFWTDGHQTEFLLAHLNL